MKVKKLGVLILAGVLTCTSPAAVFAEEVAEESMINTAVDSLLDNPDEIADIVIYVKNLIDEQDISDENISDVIDQAADHFQVSISETEKDTLLKLVKKFRDMDIDEEQLREDIKKVYETLDDFGIEKEDVKGLLRQLIDFAKSILE